jgi:hypothetical protein
MVRLLAAALLVSGIGGAQIVPPETDAAVVAVLEQPRVQDQGVSLRASGELRVVRALGGALREGERVAVEWEYRAMVNEPREPEKRIPSGQGIWLLKRIGEGWQPQPFLHDRTSSFAGGAVFPLPPEPVPPQFLAPPGASWQRALAHEVKWAIEWLAQKHGEKLNPERRVLPSGAVAMVGSGPQRLFHLAGQLLSSLPAGETRQIYQTLAESVYPNARMAGLVGLLRAGVPGTAMEIERDWTLLAPTVEAGRLSSAGLSLARLPVEDRLALARLAISETAPPFLEQTVASQLGHSGREGVLPFLAVMLESPDVNVLSSAIMSVCNLLRRTIDEPERWCPNRGPILDEAQRREISLFWRARLQDMGEATLRTPGRYATAVEQAPLEQVPLEERLYGFAITFTNTQAAHPARNMLEERDRESLAAILEKLVKDERANQEELQRAIHQRRLQGLRPDRTLADNAMKTRLALQSKALEEIRRQLSPRGWEMVDQHLRDMSAVRRRIPLRAP